MSKRLIIGITLVLLILVLGVIAYSIYSSRKPSDQQSQGQVTFPSGDGTNVNPGTSTSRHDIQIYTANGGTVTVPDFVSGTPAQQVSDNAADIQYDLTPYPDYVPGQQYPSHAFDVAFNQYSSQFLVTINEEPLGESRKKAESFLRTMLDLTNDQLCSLNAQVTVTDSVNSQYSATNLGFSFCPGAVRLPS